MENHREAVIVEALRTPTGRGRASGQLAGVHPADLLAGMIDDVLSRTGLPPERIEDVIAGCVSQAGEQGSNIARVAALAAGLPVEVPGTTVDRKCGSSQQAVHFAAQGVLAGAYDAVIACGVESMSRVPMFSAVGDEDPYGARFAARFPAGLVGQGVAAELVADRWELDRGQLDDFAARSHALAVAAEQQHWLDRELVPVDTPQGPVVRDEGVRPGTSASSLARLEPAFRTDELAERFPTLSWSIHAGNASQISDGAAAVLLMERAVAEELGLEPLARVVATAVVGSDPLLMLTGVIPATERVLERAGLDLDQIDLYEVNEAFASVPLAWLSALGGDPERLNVKGGAIANGHPLGATGAKLLSSLVHELHRRDARYGLQTVCEAGGMANAIIIERL